jgi:hypothetical protein
MYPQVIHEDIDYSNTLEITRAWIREREQWYERCEELRRQRDKARRWAGLWKAAAWLMRRHYIRTCEYLEQERDDHKATRLYLDQVRENGLPL